MKPFKLIPAIRHYAWGERGKEAFIPRLLGISPEKDAPYAEAWYGAHPSAPSRIAPQNISFYEFLKSNAGACLGERAARRFGGELPFLAKVIAAQKPLSIQAHPNERQAGEGFKSVYGDPHAKLEVIIALEDFRLLCGFRPLKEIVSLWEKTPELLPLLPGRPFSIRRIYQALMTAGQPAMDAAFSSLSERLKGKKRPEPAEDAFLNAHREHSPGLPKDRGLGFFFLLNLVHLARGKACFIPPGQIHAHLGGRGVEVMTSSDNVVRGGLTSKPVNVEELTRIADFSAGKPRIYRPRPDGYYPIPVREFRVRILRPGREQGLKTARMLLAIKGRAVVACDGSRETVSSGEALFVPSGSGARASCSAGALVFSFQLTS